MVISMNANTAIKPPEFQTDTDPIINAVRPSLSQLVGKVPKQVLNSDLLACFLFTNIQ